ncbi:MAG: Ig-like domain-containing protein [Gammaproteobacteria bacterium]
MRIHFIAAVLIFLITPCHGKDFLPDFAAVGLNKFDLAMQYLGTASGGDGSERFRKVTRAMGRKSIVDAHDADVPFMRIAVTGYAPSAYGKRGDLDLWLHNPSAYWAQIDALMDDLEAADMRAVCIFMFNPVQFPAMTRETVHDLLTDPQSRSSLLAERYIREFVQRYKHRRAVLFYELTNEFNLGADLDLAARCRKTLVAELCVPRSNYTTAEMIGYTRRFADLLHRLDPSRPVSSGFAIPRPSAEHLRAQPEWVSGKADWRLDTAAQFEKNLADIHAGIDLISVHLYPTPRSRLSPKAPTSATEELEIAKKAADSIGKPLFVGEFGDIKRIDGAPDSFPVLMLDRIAALKVPYSAVWAWEFYQRTPYTTRDSKPSAYSLEPGENDTLIAAIRQTNRKLGNRLTETVSGPDKSPPRVVLNWPLECAVLADAQAVHAVASDDSGKVARVEFWMDNRKFATDASPPYSANLTTAKLAAGRHWLTAKAYDQAGNAAEYHTLVVAAPNNRKINSTDCKL